MSTNFREISTVSWEHSHASALVSSLNNLKNIAGTCLIGSSKPYDSLGIGWGSNPVTDHLLSSGAFLIRHEGATHNRTEKVKEIADWEMGTKNLRVCWEGQLKDRNCGKCEKCVRTKLNFLLTHHPIPKCFPDWNEKINLKGIRARNKSDSKRWKLLYEYAQKNGFDKKLLSQISKVSKEKKSIKDRILPRGSKGRNLAIKTKKLLSNP